MVLQTHNNYSYVLEHLEIPQRAETNSVMHVPIQVNRNLRPSRLIRSTPEYLWRSGTTMIRISTINRQIQFFAGMHLALMLQDIRRKFCLALALRRYGAGRRAVPRPRGGSAKQPGSLPPRWACSADLIAANRRILEQGEQRARLRALTEPASCRICCSAGCCSPTTARESALRGASAHQNRRRWRKRGGS